jgi:VIT1/CCC1 family predicted Fe2+/Mn2+ transporter
VTFLLGAPLPLVAILAATRAAWRPVTVVAALAALALTAAISARLSGADRRRVLLRVVIGGALGLPITYGTGHAFGAAIS